MPTKRPKNHLMPSALSNEREKTSGIAAVMSHDTKMSSACANAKPNARYATMLFFVCMKIVYI